ncbi:SWI3 (YJL176C) [Zygosaccharomyces parabailii]|nr:SWI3 (YJL176C) [Zygosaccharomyces parabailii]CDH13526.1 uncharacterized protein ZBAI_05312 [Zygosaccharomyces bailii ISA1307]
MENPNLLGPESGRIDPQVAPSQDIAAAPRETRAEDTTAEENKDASSIALDAIQVKTTTTGGPASSLEHNQVNHVLPQKQESKAESPEPEVQTEAQPGAQQEAQLEIQPDPQPKPQPEPQLKPQSEQLVTQSEPQSEPQLESQPEAEPEPVSEEKREGNPEPVVESALGQESKPEPGLEQAPKTEQEQGNKEQPRQEDKLEEKIKDLPNEKATLQEQRIDTKPTNSNAQMEPELKVKGEDEMPKAVDNKNTNNNNDNNTDNTGDDNDYNLNKNANPEAEVQRNDSKAAPLEDGPKMPSGPEQKNAVPTSNNDLAVPQSHEIVIPNYAKWFNLTKIHPIEKESLPEFFTNRIPSKTPQVYVKYRNFMINSYRLNPNEYFSVTTARRNVCGDAAAIFRIHKFLMKWGLINYQVGAKLLPKSVEPPFTGEYSTRHDAPRGLFPFESYKPSVQLPDMAKLKKMMDTEDSSSALHKYLADERRKSHAYAPVATGEPKTKDDEKNSHARQENEAMTENPHGAKRPKIVENSMEVDDGWNKQGVQKLLEGIQTHGSDWYKIAKDVGNKTPEQCILKFLQMPIEDRFLHQNDKDSDLGSLKYAPHLPFSKSENPVMSTLAFLVGLMDPKIVQNMTSRALQSMEDVEKQQKCPPTTKEASELALSSLGVRAHVYATNEERQMNAIAHQMAQVQLQKVEAKLKLLDKIEKSLELEKKALQRQQEDVLVQRLSFAKHSRNVHLKLEESLKSFDDKEKLAAHAAEIKELIANPPKLSIGSAYDITEKNDASAERSVNNTEKEIKPVSVEAPQFYRYWSA